MVSLGDAHILGASPIDPRAQRHPLSRGPSIPIWPHGDALALDAAGPSHYSWAVIIDFHAHAFPDALAERAMRTLLGEHENIHAYTDGRLSSLIASMDRSGIDAAVIASIATKPEQFDKILAWSATIATSRVIPFGSVHPRDPLAIERVARLAAEGFRGIKLHPFYQDFYIDEEALFPIYERVRECGLILLCHTGFDIAFPRIRRCDPVRIRRVAERFPGLRFVATHLGAWSDWDEVQRHLVGQPISMELSYSLGELPPERARAIILGHPEDRVMFGSDSPWQDQQETRTRLKALDLGPARERAILGENARRLLGI